MSSPSPERAQKRFAGVSEFQILDFSVPLRIDPWYATLRLQAIVDALLKLFTGNFVIGLRGKNKISLVMGWRLALEVESGQLVQEGMAEESVGNRADESTITLILRWTIVCRASARTSVEP